MCGRAAVQATVRGIGRLKWDQTAVEVNLS